LLGEKDRLVKRTVTIFACFVTILMIEERLRADSMPLSAGGVSNSQVVPLGYWTYGTTAATGPIVAGTLVIGGTETDSSTVTIAASDADGNLLTPTAVLTLTGTGQMTGLGSPLTNLAWSPDHLTVSPVLEPTIVTWTASAPGSYTITSTILPTHSSSNSGLGVATLTGGAGGSGNDSGGQFSQTVNFNSGDTVSFLAAAQGGSSDGPIEISFGSPVEPVPEPSSWVAFLGLAGTAFLGLTWMSRGRFRWASPR
jgi:hypothetical protein